MNQPWLIFCEYDHYCQGWETVSGSFLVYSDTFENACAKLHRLGMTIEAENARNFRNLTLE